MRNVVATKKRKSLIIKEMNILSAEVRSPAQIAILPVADRHLDYAREIKKKFFDASFETKVDESSESISKKVREAQLEQYNYILTVGDKEVAEKNISVRTRDNIVHGQMDISAFLALISEERDRKSLCSPLSPTAV